MFSRPAITTLLLPCLLLLTLTAAPSFSADDHSHHQHHQAKAAPKITPPKIIYNPNPKIVEFQLKRLNDERLVLIERSTDNVKYKVVYQYFLKRPTLASKYHTEAVKALATLNQTSQIEELLIVIDQIDSSKPDQAKMLNQLVRMLTEQPKADLAARRDQLVTFAKKATTNDVRRGFYQGIMTADGSIDAVWTLASASPAHLMSAIEALPSLKDDALRLSFFPKLKAVLTTDSQADLWPAALHSLGSIPGHHAERLALLIQSHYFKKSPMAVTHSLKQIPSSTFTADQATTLVARLITLLEATPKKDRTAPLAIQAGDLGRSLIGRLPEADRSQAVQQFSKLAVRVITLIAILEEMTYDKKTFTVQAGETVQIIFKNDDMMGHNIVFTKPGKETMIQVAEAGELVGDKGAPTGNPAQPKTKPYTPNSPDVLFASDFVEANQVVRMTFTAPPAGEYPYVCTFPGHWMKMYGTMLVVDDMLAWEKNPIAPKDLLLESAEDLAKQPKLFQDGKKLFVDATCAACHKLGPLPGGIIGPDLAEAFGRFNNDRQLVLEEINNPNKSIHPQYQTNQLTLKDGSVLSGRVEKEDDQTLTLIPIGMTAGQSIQKSTIQQRMKLPVSTMPPGLLARFTKEQIDALLTLIEARGDVASPAYKP